MPAKETLLGSTAPVLWEELRRAVMRLEAFSVQQPKHSPSRLCQLHAAAG